MKLITKNTLITIFFLCAAVFGQSLPAASQDLKSAEAAFFQLIEKEGVQKARQIYEETKKRDSNAVLFSEAGMNTLGYKFVREKRVPEAIEIFRLNVEAYPQSANVYDSLAEAYMIDGQKKIAAEYYRKALTILPNNESEIRILQSLGEPVSSEEWAKLFASKFPANIEYLPNIEFGTGGGRPLKLDILRLRKRSSKPLPVIVFIHGGGWSEGTKERGLYSLLHFAERGYLAVTIEYRLSSEALFPAQIEDVKCAIRYLRAHAKKLHLDPKNIGVWGQSAGGHLAALLGTSGDVKELEGTGGWQKFSSRVQAVAAWNPPVDFFKNELAVRAVKPEDDATFRLLGGPLSSNKEKAVMANPMTYATKDDPPFLILHGDKDRVVLPEQSRFLYEALKNVGVKVELNLIENDTHFGASYNQPGAVSDALESNRAKIEEMMDSFFDKYLKNK
jgi:acetyl esterase/lipase